MNQEKALWQTFCNQYYYDRKSSFALDISRMNIPEQLLEADRSSIFKSMQELERGAIANPDEQRMVGHYWLRAAELAPSAELSKAIQDTLSNIKDFAAQVHSGKIAAKDGEKFNHLLLVGIGGSALGPQLVYNALRTSERPLSVSFFDNTDADGMAKVLSEIPDLKRTLVIIISKSGGTKETRNGQVIAKEVLKSLGLNPAAQLVAVTGEGSELDKTAIAEGWLARFPMWDWVGGRTSELSAVGLLPAALHGVDIDALLRGAREMDQLTRQEKVKENPAALLALAWWHAGSGKGSKDMVVLPYNDRLELISRYLQQLVMESLGKEHDLNGKVVNQGIAVYGNKGSTDQHAYVQQLRDGINNFFTVFIEVLNCPQTKYNFASPTSIEVEPGVTCADYLGGFLLGTRDALYEKGRLSITISIEQVNAYCLGQLIALFERAVGYYASLVNINAYHQPGVEAGKRAAQAVLDLQKQIERVLANNKTALSVNEIANQLEKLDSQEIIFLILRRLAATGKVSIAQASSVFEDRFTLKL